MPGAGGAGDGAENAMERKSYVNEDGEWRFRKISFFGVVRSFVSQLKPGQDMTRVALPAILLHPFSILEQVGNRKLPYFDTVLLDITQQEDPLQRLLTAVKYYACAFQNEDMHKKPYNPILGETHKCTVRSEQFGESHFVAEQVSHHPPVSAVVAINKRVGVVLTGTMSFKIKFGNNVQVVTDGASTIHVERFNETYVVPKIAPDLLIKNVVMPGKKTIFWVEDVTIDCPKTGYSASINFGDNVFSGEVFHVSRDGAVAKFSGKCGGEVTLTDVATGAKSCLIDVKAQPVSELIYPPLSELQHVDPMDSRCIWRDVSTHIVANDMEKADEIKKGIEQSQREKLNTQREENDGELPPYVGKYFVADGPSWRFRSNILDNPTPDELSDDMLEGPVSIARSDKRRPRRGVGSLASIAETSETSLTVDERQAMEDRQTLIRSFAVIDTSSEGESDRTESSSSDEAASPEVESPEVVSDDEIDTPLSPRSRGFVRRPSLAGARKLARIPGRHRSKKKEPAIARSSDALRAAAAVQPAKDLVAAMARLPRNTVLQKGWMKLRNSMKVWITRWVALHPGRLVYYKDDKDMLFDRCAGIIELAQCRIKKRQTAKDGFSFKIYHIARYPIYQKYDLQGKKIRSAMLPLSSSYAIFRVASLQEQSYWMNAIAEQIAYADMLGSKSSLPRLIMDSKLNGESDTSADERESEAIDSGGEKEGETRRRRRNGKDHEHRTAVRAILQKYVAAGKRRASLVGESSVEETLSDWRRGADARITAIDRTVTEALRTSTVEGSLELERTWFFLLLLLLVVLGWLL